MRRMDTQCPKTQNLIGEAGNFPTVMDLLREYGIEVHVDGILPPILSLIRNLGPSIERQCSLLELVPHIYYLLADQL